MRLPVSNKGRIITAAIAMTVILTGSFGLSACSGKALEPFNDADVSNQNKGPAEVINMPDGFSNVATKCDHGNRVYVVFHSNSAYGSVAVVANDPSCVGK